MLEVPEWLCQICGRKPQLDTEEGGRHLMLVCQCVQVHVADGNWLTEIHKTDS